MNHIIRYPVPKRIVNAFIIRILRDKNVNRVH